MSINTGSIYVTKLIATVVVITLGFHQVLSMGRLSACLLRLSRNIQVVVCLIDSPKVTPTAVSVCPGETVTFTCVVPQGSQKLRWNVDFNNPSLPDIGRERLFMMSNEVGDIFNAMSYMELFNFTLTSKSPFTSTMVTRADAQLNDAAVTCDNTIDATITVHLSITIIQGIRNLLSHS